MKFIPRHCYLRVASGRTSLSNRLALIPALPRDHKANSAQGRPTTDSSRASMPPTSRSTPSALAAPTSSLRCSSSEAPAIIATSHEFCHG